MIEAVIFDWAGTTVDYGCFAPVKAFMEAFAHYGVPVTMEETRKPMGMLKRDHIRTMLHMERIAAEWKRVHGHEATEEAVDAVYAQFEPKLFSILDQYADPKPFAVETAAKLREMGLKIGSTTGYTDAMMNIVVPKAAQQGYAPDCWVSPDGAEGKGRPYPYMIFANMQKLGVTSVRNVVKVGDTITHIARPCDKAIAGFEEVKPMVFAGVYPIEAEDFEDLRASLEKLQLNDASLTFQPESSLALGFGFRCGFLGLLHMEIVQERLDREFDMNVITTVPNVSYHIYDKQGNMKEVHNPGGMPDPTMIDHIEEPYIKASIITTTDYIGPIMTLCLGKRGELIKQEYISGNRVEIYYNMPLGEIVIDFYDKLKSISKGYASFDYHPNGFRTSKLVKLDILLNGEPVDALSTLTHIDNAYDMGRRMCEKLKELIPRQQFDIAIQAAIGAKIISRETIKAVRKDVTAKCYGGDVSRKRKLLEKQKKGKKRMKQIGNVEVPQKAFLAVLKLD